MQASHKVQPITIRVGTVRWNNIAKSTLCTVALYETE